MMLWLIPRDKGASFLDGARDLDLWRRRTAGSTGRRSEIVPCRKASDGSYCSSIMHLAGSRG